MRDLTKEQKILLDNWYKRQPEEKILGLSWSLSKDDDFTLELYDEIEKLNDTEILYQNIERYIQDKAMNEIK